MNTLFLQYKQFHSKWPWLTPLILVCLTILIILYLRSTKPEPPTRVTPEKEWLVSAESVRFQTLQPQLNLLGRVSNPFDSILSAGIVADVSNVTVREGMHVKQGTSLIILDKQEIMLLVAQREADIAELKSQITSEKNRYAADQLALKEEQQLLNLAEQAVKRQASLQASNLVAQERIDNAESQRAQRALSVNARNLLLADHPSRLAQLNARLTRAETALKDALLDAQRSAINAPFDGVITAVNVSPGERVQIGQALVSLYDINSMEVRAQIPDRHVNIIRQALQQEQVIEAHTLKFGEQHKLILQRLAGQVKTGSGGLNAIFVPLNARHEFVLNHALEVWVSLPGIEHTFSLPLAAVYGGNRVYRVIEERLQAIDVKVVGKQLDPLGKEDRAIIESKILNEGDIIATTQLPNAISGLKVKVRD